MNVEYNVMVICCHLILLNIGFVPRYKSILIIFAAVAYRYITSYVLSRACYRQTLILIRFPNLDSISVEGQLEC